MNYTKITVYLVALTVTIFLAACQPTPDAPIVNAGDDAELNNKIEATAIPTPETEENLSSIYGFPTFYEDEFKCLDNDVSFTISAGVIVPDVKSAPVVEVAPTTFSPEYIKNALENLHPNVTFYDRRLRMGRDEIEKEIVELKSLLAGSYEDFAKRYAESSGITDDESAKEYYDECKFCLEKYKEMLSDAPETSERVPFDFQYTEYNYSNYIYDPSYEYNHSSDGYDKEESSRRKSMHMVGETQDGLFLEIRVLTGDSDINPGSIVHQFLYSVGPYSDQRYWMINQTAKMKLSQAEATSLGNDALEKMGLSDIMILTKTTRLTNNNELHGYELEYHRDLSGFAASGVNIENEYNYIAGNETITITIMNDMVVRIYYENPYEIPGMENENVELVPFDEVYAAFKRQAAVEFTRGSAAGIYVNDAPADDEINNVDVTITKIKLATVRIPIKNGGYRYVPAWQFEGTRTVENANNVKYTDGTDDPITFMTINAVDGTRIAGLE